MVILYSLAFIIGMVVIADAAIYFAKREIIEPRVLSVYPKMNCTRFAVLEIILGIVVMYGSLSQIVCQNVV